MIDQQILHLQDALSRKRRQLGEKDPYTFAKIYLTNNCHIPFSRMHVEVFDYLAKITVKRKGRLAIAAPRGHAKSTIVTLAYVLWCLVYKKERLILIASNSREQAETLLKDVKQQFYDNVLLATDFPELSPTLKPKPWRNNKIQLPNRTMVVVYGAGQSPRGIKNDRDRPGLIIADDLENEEQAQVEEQRDKLRTWFRSTLLNTGHAQTNVVVVGTVLHQDSLLANLIDPVLTPGWEGHKYQAVERFCDDAQIWQEWVGILQRKQDYQGETGMDAADQFFDENSEAMLSGTKVLWPQRESYYDLMLLKETEGLRSFQSEKQNEPLDPNQCIFKQENITFWDDTHRTTEELLRYLGTEADIYGACDPSLGKSLRGDYTAIVILARHRQTKTCYVLAADLLHCRPDEAIERILVHARMHRFRYFAVESNQFQELMVNDLERRARETCTSLNLHKINNRSNKQSRISGLEPHLCQGRVQLCRQHQGLLGQLLQFPLAKNDDGPDALEMAVTAATNVHRTYSIPIAGMF